LLYVVAIDHLIITGLFTNVVARWPGSTHDSHILRTSAIGDILIGTGLRDGVILGDSGYACSPFLMTPYFNPTTRKQENYNRAHKTTRCLIERSFGVLKRSFYILHSEIRMAPDRVCTIIVACCILHNIAVLFREPDVDGIDNNELPQDMQEHYHGQENGQSTRQHIAKTYF